MVLAKNIFKTILILLGIALMAVIFCFALMLLFHISIFNYTYMKLSDSETLSVVDIDVTNLKSVDISTSNIDVIIAHSNDDGFDTATILTVVDMSGIFKDNVKKVTYVQNPSIDENGVLKIETKEPAGLFFNNKSYVKLLVPKTKNFENIVINSNAKVISVGDGDNTVVDNMEITAGKKMFNAAISIGKDLTINNKLKLKTNYGRIIIESKINGNVEVESLAGAIQFNTSIGGGLVVTGENPFVQVGTFPGNWRNKTEIKDKDLVGLTRYDVAGDVTINNVTNGGNVKVSGKIGGYVYMNGDAIEFWANKIVGGLVSDSGSNQIRIYGSLGTTSSTNTCVIDSGYGCLYINKCYTKLNASCDKGGITVMKAYNDIIVDRNRNSDTYICFANDVTGKSLTVINEKGNITAKNISGVAMLDAKSGKVTAEFADVVGDSKVISNYDANIKVKDGKTFSLTAKAKKNTSVNVQLGSVTYKNWDGATDEGYYKVRTDIINPNGDDVPANSLTVNVVEKAKLEVSFI